MTHKNYRNLITYFSILLLLHSCLLPIIIKMDSSIIQWNCRGIGTSHEELSVLIAELNPSLICLQETFLKNNKLITRDTNPTTTSTIQVQEPLEVYRFSLKIVYPKAKSPWTQTYKQLQ